MKKSRIASPVPHTESPLRHLPLVDLLVDTKTRAVGIGPAIGPEGLQHDARGRSHNPLWAAVCPRTRAAGEPGRHDAQRSGAGWPEGHDPASARPHRGRRGRAAHVSDDGRDRSARSAGRRADAGRRGHPAVRAEPGAARLRRCRAGARVRAPSAVVSSPARRRSSRPGRARRSTASTSSRC